VGAGPGEADMQLSSFGPRVPDLTQP
jgi:hypothetical protein